MISDEDMWVMHVPVLSTGHLTYKTANAEITPDHNGPGDLLTIRFPEGFLVFCSDESVLVDIDVPGDLRACLKWAQTNGYEWLRFDSAGDQVGELPVYEW